jgi:hypothetical protein
MKLTNQPSETERFHSVSRPSAHHKEISMSFLSRLCFYAGLLSVPLSICLWAWGPEWPGSISSFTDSAQRAAHQERWGLFVGLWSPTLLILSQIFEARSREYRDTARLLDS